MPRSIPPPPRLLLISLAMMTFFCSLGGAWVTHSQKPKTPVQVSEAANAPQETAFVGVRLLVAGQEGAMQLQEEYKAKGYQITSHPIQIPVRVAAGYIVADRLEPLAAQPAAEALTKVYHFQVSSREESNGRVLVQVGPAYQRKEDAEKTVGKLKQLGFVWRVEPNFVEKPEKRFEILLSHVPAQAADRMKDSLTNRGIEVSITHSP